VQSFPLIDSFSEPPFIPSLFSPNLSCPSCLFKGFIYCRDPATPSCFLSSPIDDVDNYQRCFNIKGIEEIISICESEKSNSEMKIGPGEARYIKIEKD
jgi:hypothetical protein